MTLSVTWTLPEPNLRTDATENRLGLVTCGARIRASLTSLLMAYPVPYRTVNNKPAKTVAFLVVSGG